jgi:hypothetical protein
MAKTTDMFNIQARVRPTQSQDRLQPGEIIVSVPKGKQHNIKSSKYTTDEINKLLTGYISIPQNTWAAIDHGAHVRYVRSDGRFVRGGFVSGYSTHNDRQLLTLANGFNATVKGYSVWTIGLDSIKYIYVKKKSAPSTARIEASPRAQSKTTEIAELKKIILDMQKRIKMIEYKRIKK